MEPLFNFVHCDGLNSDDQSTNFSKVITDTLLETQETVRTIREEGPPGRERSSRPRAQAGGYAPRSG